MNFLAGLIGATAVAASDKWKLDDEEERRARYRQADSDLRIKEQRVTEELKERAEVAREQRASTQAEKLRTDQASRIDDEAGKIADTEVGATADRRAVLADPMTRVRAAGNAGYLRADQVAAAQLGRQDKERDDARTEKKDDQNYKMDQDKLKAQVAHWKVIESSAGGDPNTKALAAMKLKLAEEELKWRKELTALPLGDPLRAAKIQSGIDMGWDRRVPPDVSTTVETTTGTDANPVKTSVTTKGQAGAATSAQTESQAQAQAKTAISAGRIDLAGANKRLEAAGFKAISDNTPQKPKNLRELKRIASKPKGVSTAEANEAQAEIDYLKNNRDRITATE